jgi:hypothetical protein
MDAEAKRLAALKEELRKDMEALERVERLMAAKNGSLSRPDDRQLPLPISPKPNHEAMDTEDDDADDAPRDSLRATIADLLNSDPSIRWTTQKVLARLEEMKFPLRAKEPIYSVGQTLAVLVKKEKIRLARKGSGSAPHIYKGKIASDNSSARLADTHNRAVDVRPFEIGGSDVESTKAD